MPEIPSVPLEKPSDLLAGLEMLLQELGNWLHGAMPAHLDQEWQGIHDEGTFLTAWAGYYAFTQDPQVPALATDLFDKWERWAQDHFLHGYHPTQEVHHGTEHFLIFVDWLYRIVPDHPRIRAALADGTRHVGNWAADTPAWFDWQTRRYVSYSLGTQKTGTEGFNFVDHLRLLHMAMSGYRATGEARYLDLGRQYGRVWATAIRDLPEIPLYLEANAHSAAQYTGLLQSFLKAAPQDLTPFARLENHIASGGPKLWRELSAATGEEVFHQAALRLGQGCVQHLSSPIANPAGQVLCSLLEDGVAPAELGISDATFAPGKIRQDLEGRHLAIEVGRTPDLPDSIGYRFDMPTYVVTARNGTRYPLQLPAPANLMLAWSLTGQETCAVDACCLALGKLRLARQVFRDGRHHGCTARSVAAVVRGHGRCWGAGDVSSILAHPGARQVYATAFPDRTDFPGLITN